MSTILDALRKLQRERERAKPPRDLQESVTQPLSVTRSPRRPSRRFVGVGGIGLLCLLAGGVLIWKWPALRGATPEVPPSARGSEPSASPPVTQPRVAARTGPTRPRQAVARRGRAAPPESPTTPALGPTPRRDPSSQSLEPEPAARVTRAATAERTLMAEPVTAALSSPERKTTSTLSAGPTAEKVEPVAKAKPAKKSRVSGRRQRDRPRSSKETAAAAVPKLPPAASAVAQRSTGKASTPAPKAPPKSTPKATVKPAPPPAQVTEAKRRSPPEPNPFLQRFEPVTRVERAPADTQELVGEPSPVFTYFPELALESVRWHPDPSRRVANLVVDRARGITVREGDIVRGALIHRIDPGAVELRVGTAKKLLQMGP